MYNVQLEIKIFEWNSIYWEYRYGAIYVFIKAYKKIIESELWPLEIGHLNHDIYSKFPVDF